MSLLHRSQRLPRHLIVIPVAIGLILIVIGVLRAPVADSLNGVNKGTYQLVTLTTGESYVGRLTDITGRYVILRDVYFQPANATAQDGAAQPSEITVQRLSGTVAKPEDVMRISGDHIVHWENLARDSKIVQAIEQSDQ